MYGNVEPWCWVRSCQVNISSLFSEAGPSLMFFETGANFWYSVPRQTIHCFLLIVTIQDLPYLFLSASHLHFLSFFDIYIFFILTSLFWSHVWRFYLPVCWYRVGWHATRAPAWNLTLWLHLSYFYPYFGAFVWSGVHDINALSTVEVKAGTVTSKFSKIFVSISLYYICSFLIWHLFLSAF